MKFFKQHLLGFVSGAIFAVAAVGAQELQQNSIESMAVASQGGVVNVKLTFKEPLAKAPLGFAVAKPARIAIDFPHTTNGLGKNSQTYNEGDLRSVNVIEAEGRTRLVLNLNQAMSYETSIDGNSLVLALVRSAKEGAAPLVEHFSETKQFQTSNSIRDVVFRRGRDGEARILVDLSDPNAGIDIRQQGQNLVVDFVKVTVPESLRKKLDVTDFATPVVSVNTTQQGVNTRMIISPRGLWEHNAYQSDNQFVIEVKPVIENPNKLVQGSRGGYQGEKLSLNFQNVDVRRLLQVIGEFTGMNMVVSDSVGGSITLILKDVPWDQALDIILKQKDLDMRKNGNVIMIAPRDEIAVKEKLDFESRSQIGDLEPLRTESFQLNYIKAADVQKLLIDQKQPLISKRGSVSVEERSNIMFVKDTPSSLDNVRDIVAKVDVSVRQVMIEARIVEAGDSFAKNLGIRLGFNDLRNFGDRSGPGVTVGGNIRNTGWQTVQGPRELEGTYPDFYPVSKTTPPLFNDPDRKANINDSLSVNMPATPRAGNAGQFSMVLFNSAKTMFINAEISALEADGKGKVVSSPRVMTTNQVEAEIRQGLDIPYPTADSNGVQTIAYKRADLSLKVKPQITPDGRVTMKVDVTKNSPSSISTGGYGLAIDTKAVNTEVLVENGGTLVIGGIYTQKTQETTQRIPFFGDLPYVGWLFKNKEWIDDKTELLVFITPKIVSDGLSLR